MRYLLKNPKRLLVPAAELALSIVSYFLSFLIRFESLPQGEYWNIFLKTLPLVFSVRFSCLWYFGLYRGIWSYASVNDLLAIIKAVSVGTAIIVLGVIFTFGHGYPRSVFIIDWLLMVIILGGERFLIRIRRNWRRLNKERNSKRLLIVGAGDAGEMILREILNNPKLSFTPVGFADDDPKKQGRAIHGIPVLGRIDNLCQIIQRNKIEEIIIAIPSIGRNKIHQIVDLCIQSKVKYKTVPALADLVNGTVSVNNLREVKIEDLLGREPVELDTEKTGNYLRGKVILVSGASGSIGSEICRQVLKHRPRLLILLERAESGLFYLEMELKRDYPEQKIAAVLADIADQEKINRVFSHYRPQIVYHCAAYKHVPIIEAHPEEAVKNNIWGTTVLARAAINYEVKEFVMLSTDKAVEPANFMGASKRLAELYLQGLNQKVATQFITVRFGNVLDSEGSVVPIFRRQIKEGRALTVTHPEVKRYFMSIPEAVSLVLEASCLGRGGEIFILEMGRPVKIVDLAYDLIKLSGLEPEKDVKINFTGLRPGEKLQEALFSGSEELIPTKNKKIFSIRTKSQIFPEDKDVEELRLLAGYSDISGIVAKFKQLIPGFNTLSWEKKSFAEGILIVDDDRTIRCLLRKYLEGKGYNVVETENGEKALQFITTTPAEIRLIFLDIRMPGSRDGLATLREIKTFNSLVEVVLITAYSTEKIKLAGKEFGAYRQIDKPFNLEDIRLITEEILGTKKNIQGAVFS